MSYVFIIEFEHSSSIFQVFPLISS